MRPSLAVFLICMYQPPARGLATPDDDLVLDAATGDSVAHEGGSLRVRKRHLCVLQVLRGSCILHQESRRQGPESLLNSGGGQV